MDDNEPFPMHGWTERECEVVVALYEYCVELAEIEGKPISFEQELGPILLRLIFEMLPRYSDKRKARFAKEVVRRIHRALYPNYTN